MATPVEEQAIEDPEAMSVSTSDLERAGPTAKLRQPDIQGKEKFRLATLASAPWPGWIYPTSLRLLSLAGFFLILVFAFLGNRHGENNFATQVVWLLWWPLLPVSFVLLGRVWCAVCPVGALGDYLQRLLPWSRREPGLLIRTYGVWIGALLFFILFWADLVLRVGEEPTRTGVLLLILTGLSLLLGLIYERRVWCRFLCPVGIMGGLFSLLAPFGLRARRQTICTKQCSGGCSPKICPLYETPRRLANNQHCSLCWQCVRACQRDSLRLAANSFSRGLVNVRWPSLGEGVFAVMLLGMLLVEVFRMTPLFPRFMRWSLQGMASLGYEAVLTINVVGVGVLVVFLFLLIREFSQRLAPEERESLAVSRLSLSLLPVVAATSLGLSLIHLRMRGPWAIQTAIDQLHIPLRLFVLDAPVRGSLYMTNPPLSLSILLLVIAGMILSAMSMRHLQSSAGRLPAIALLPFGLLAVTLGGAASILFLLPLGVMH